MPKSPVNTFFVVVLALFGVGCALSMSLMSTFVIPWSFYLLFLLIRSFSSDFRQLGFWGLAYREAPLFLGMGYVLYAALMLMAKVSFEQAQGALSFLLLYVYLFLCFRSERLQLAAPTKWRIEWIVGVAYVMLWAFCFYQQQFEGVRRAVGFHRNPNYLAIALLPPIIYYGEWLMRYFRIQVARRGALAFVVLLELALVHTLFLTATRSALPAALLYLFCLLCRLLWDQRQRFRLWMLAACVSGVGAVGYLLTNSFVWRRLQWKRLLRDRNILSRFEIWKINWEKFLEDPLTGTGFRQNDIAFNDYKSISRYVKDGGSGHFAHNAYLQALAEGGMIGFVLFFATLLVGFLRHSHLRWFLVVFLIAGLADSSFHTSRSLYPLIFFMTLAHIQTFSKRDDTHAA